MAGCYQALGEVLMAQGKRGDAADPLHASAELWRGLLMIDPLRRSYREGLAGTLEAYGRALKALGEEEADAAAVASVEEAWRGAISLREGLITDFADEPLYHARRADGLNDLAWHLLSRPGRSIDDAHHAIELARAAVESVRDRDTYWNTLGIAYLYAGEWASAVTSLRASADLTDGGSGFDLFPLAMAYARLGDHDAAQECYRRAVAWMEEHDPAHPDLRRLSAEATDLLSGTYT
jgi:tetratricopeptide (TPR) repeat protein